MPAPKHPDLSALKALDRAITKARQAINDSAPQVDPVHVAAVQDAISRLRDLERDLAIDLGRAMGAAQGELPDGRLFTLKRAQDRKEWDHDDWKRDVRRAITDAITERFVDLDGPGDDGTYPDVQVIDQATGEVVTLGHVVQAALAEAQNVHGSTAPRSTSLKALGLYASDYCTSSPGGWTFRSTPKTTTIQEN